MPAEPERSNKPDTHQHVDTQAGQPANPEMAGKVNEDSFETPTRPDSQAMPGAWPVPPPHSDSGTRQRYFTQLQEQYGNAHVQRMIGQTAVQRHHTIINNTVLRPVLRRSTSQETPVIQRQPAPAAEKKGTLADAIASGDPAQVSDLIPSKLGKATDDQKIQIIDLFLDKGDFFAKAKVPLIWDSFGKNLESVANSHADQWKKSFDIAGDHMRASNLFHAQYSVFYQDVEDVAAGYLDQNEAYCAAELKRLGLTETGEVAIGPPTQDQANQLKNTQAGANKLVADQDALRDLRKVMVGYTRTIVKEGSPGGTDVKPEYLDEKAPFDPDQRPQLDPKPGDGMKSWTEVKKIHDDLITLIQARISVNPSLFALVRGNYEDTSKTSVVAKGSRENALSTLGGGLHDTLQNIQKTRPLLGALKEDLQPIHQQLLSGQVTAPKAKSRNWKTNPYYNVLGQAVVKSHDPGPWWKILGLAAAELAAWVVAGMATGGVAIGVGMAANDLAQVALNEGKAQAISAASQTNVTASTALVSDGQVKEAESAVIESAAFAVLDTVLAAGAVRGALREVFHYEQEAAKAAKEASKLADKALATQAREEAEQAAKEARVNAEKAKASASETRIAAKNATEEEATRAQQEVERADKEAVDADRFAKDTEALAGEAKGGKEHAKPRKVGDHEVGVRGNWITRCSEAPCIELAKSVADRVKIALDKIVGLNLGERTEELGARLKASQQRAEALAEKARGELATTADRVATENKFQDLGAQIESDVQAIEKQVELESLAMKGQYNRQWGEMVVDNIKTRIKVTIERATTGGKPIPKKLGADLKRFEEKANQLAAAAAEQEKPANLRRTTLTADDLALKWKELDKGIEGVEREERVRRDLVELGGKSLGETDDEVRKGLGLKGQKGAKNPSPDFGIDLGGGTLMLAESKASDIEHALEQIAAGMNSPTGKTFAKFDLRIYLKQTEFEALIDGTSKSGFTASQVGGEWFLQGNRTTVNNLPVKIFPG